MRKFYDGMDGSEFGGGLNAVIDELPRLNNQIFGIEAYRFSGVWAFNNESLGLVNELFVGGADTYIDKMVGMDVDKAGIQFSTIPFPGHQAVVTHVEGEANSGTTYTDKDGHILWLCPVLFLYFNGTPEKIYVSFKPMK